MSTHGPDDVIAKSKNIEELIEAIYSKYGLILNRQQMLKGIGLLREYLAKPDNRNSVLNDINALYKYDNDIVQKLQAFAVTEDQEVIKRKIAQAKTFEDLMSVMKMEGLRDAQGHNVSGYARDFMIRTLNTVIQDHRNFGTGLDSSAIKVDPSYGFMDKLQEIGNNIQKSVNERNQKILEERSKQRQEILEKQKEQQSPQNTEINLAKSRIDGFNVENSYENVRSGKSIQKITTEQKKKSIKELQEIVNKFKENKNPTTLDIVAVRSQIAELDKTQSKRSSLKHVIKNLTTQLDDLETKLNNKALQGVLQSAVKLASDFHGAQAKARLQNDPNDRRAPSVTQMHLSQEHSQIQNLHIDLLALKRKAETQPHSCNVKKELETLISKHEKVCQKLGKEHPLTVKVHEIRDLVISPAESGQLKAKRKNT